MNSIFNKYLKQNICLKNNCIQCCLQTSMFLSLNDIGRIQKQGFLKDYFVKEKNDWLLLRNIQGRCVFHNGKDCKIYSIRPEGCRLYPLIYDEEYHLSIIDEFCPFKDEFRFQSIDIERLLDLVKQLKDERDARRKRRG